MKKIIILCALVSLSGCGGITMIDEKQQAMIETKLPAIDPKGGQLCICRASNFAGSGAIVGLKANDENIGELPNSSYFCINLSPDQYSITGDCTMCSRMGSETIIKQGQRKYMELYVGMNGMNLHSTSREIGLSCINGRM